MNQKQFFAVLFFAAVALSGCDRFKKNDEPPASNTATPTKKSEMRGLKRKLKIDTATVWVEIADRDDTRARGLMERREMPNDEGMLFVFAQPDKQSFWMKNTYLPLDIAYVDEQLQITDIHQMKPMGGSTEADDKLPRYESTKAVPYAIELNQGWFKKKGIVVGAKVKFE
jgi:uncharacterized protein